MLKKKSNIVRIFLEEDYAKMSQEYLEISSHIKELENKKKHLAEKIKEGADLYGVKDDKGSVYCDRDNIIFGKMAKKTVKINHEKAIAIFEDKGLTDLVKVEILKTVDEDKMEQAIKEGRLKMETVEKVTDVNTSYSVFVKAKEEMPEIIESKVARTK